MFFIVFHWYSVEKASISSCSNLGKYENIDLFEKSLKKGQWMLEILKYLVDFFYLVVVWWKLTEFIQDKVLPRGLGGGGNSFDHPVHKRN